MQAKSHMEENKNVGLQFQWGIKRGVGGAKKDVQFYESFTFDEVHYTLYDCVCLFKKGVTEPYIGKIVKIWEQGDGKKKVKILWFFLPSEIHNYLGNHKPLEKEIFLASGEGVGLANINPLEAIAAKCSVICTSDDGRNPQPCRDALEKADFIFYRTFDVGTLTISDQLPDKIAGIEVKALLNRKEDQVGPVVNESDTRGKAENDPSETLKSEKKDGVGQASLSVSLKERVSGKQDQNEVNCHLVKNRDKKSGIDSSRDVGESNTSAGLHADEKVPSVKHKAQSDIANDRPSKKMRLSTDSMKPDDLQTNKHATVAKKILIKSDKDDSDKVSTQLHKENSEKMKLSEKKVKSSGESLQKAEDHVVTRRPETDRSKWFKELPWDARIQKAHDQGTLVFLQNFNPSLNSRNIEDIIYHIFKQSCTAKVIPLCPPYVNPNYGQAYVIFKTRTAAEEAIQKINAGCLMVQNKSALIASKGLLEMPEKPKTLVGHLGVNNNKKMQREEMRKAVSTAHCSQPNTIEYEMAMDWILVQEKTVNCFNRLHKGHGDAARKLRRNLKSNK